MRRALVAVMIAGLVAGTASASPAPVTVSFTIDYGGFSGLVQSVPLGAAVAQLSGGAGHLTGLALPASALGVVAATTVLTDPGVSPVEGLWLDVHVGAGALATGGGPLGGILPLSGVSKLCLFDYCLNAPVANISVPLSVVGVGGSATLVGSAINVTVTGASWTTGTASVPAGGQFPALTRMGFAHGPASLTSSTAALSGVASLVTPIAVTTTLTAVSFLPGFATLQIHVVPEPATLLLLGAGVALLAAKGRRQRR